MKAKRTSVLAIAIGLGIAALLGLLGVLHALAPDDDAIRAEFGARIARVTQMPDADPAAKDRAVEELLRVEDYKKYSRAQWNRLDRLHHALHQDVQADMAARKVVRPFVDLCKSLEGRTAGELRELDERARAFQAEYGSTRCGPPLAVIRARIAEALASLAPACTDLDHFRILEEIEKDRISGRFASSLKRTNGAVAKHAGCADFIAGLKREREKVLGSASLAAEKLLKEARALRADGRKEEACRSLDQALPNYEGMPEEGRIRALGNELRGT